MLRFAQHDIGPEALDQAKPDYLEVPEGLDVLHVSVHHRRRALEAAAVGFPVHLEPRRGPALLRRNPLAHSRNGKILYAAPKFGCAVGQGDEIGTKRLAINEDDVATNFQLRLSFGPADGVLKRTGISHQRS